jgi:hypothetical protein
LGSSSRRDNSLRSRELRVSSNYSRNNGERADRWGPEVECSRGYADTRRDFSLSPVRCFPGRRHDADRPRSENWKPNLFDGKQDWKRYLMQFELVAEVNQWNSVQKAVNLARSLIGSARTVLADLTLEQFKHFPTLVAAIERRYQPREKILANKALFNTRKQKSDEDAASYSEVLRLLARQAFPDASAEVREERICDRFVEGLADTELRRHIYLSHLTSLEAVVSVAIEWEAINETIHMGGFRKPKNSENVASVSWEEHDSVKQLCVQVRNLAESYEKMVEFIHFNNCEVLNFRGSDTSFCRDDARGSCGQKGQYSQDCGKWTGEQRRVINSVRNFPEQMQQTRIHDCDSYSHWKFGNNNYPTSESSQEMLVADEHLSDETCRPSSYMQQGNY